MELRILALIIVLFSVIALTAPPFGRDRYAGVYASPATAYYGFALDLFKHMGGGESNTVVSPLSVYIALSMLAEGAAGETREELAKFLRVEDIRVAREWLRLVAETYLNVSDNATTSIANAAWLRSDYRFSSSYLDILEENYKAETREMRLGAGPEVVASEINDWVKEKTHGLIDRVVDPHSISPKTVLILVNALYFKAPWLKPFEETVTGDFHSPEGVVTVDYMKGEIKARVYRERGLTAIALDYRGTNVKMVILMPSDGDTAKLLEELTPDRLTSILEELLSSEPITLELYMPLFDVDSGQLRLDEVLKDMGLKLIFDPSRADFRYITGSPRNPGLYVDGVYHRARVKVDLWGTEAAAATAIGVLVSAVATVETIWIDRPFIFMLVDPTTGAVLFLGSVVKP